MKKSKSRTLFFGCIILLLAAAAVFVYLRSTEKTQSDIDTVSYEEAYLKYVKENPSYFSRGMLLCDLNTDNIPELFSLEYSEDGEIMKLHQYKKDKLAADKNFSRKYITTEYLSVGESFFESPPRFCSIYTHKATGEKALIISMSRSDGEDLFDIITYDGKTAAAEDVSVKTSGKSDGTTFVSLQKKRDDVMANYALSQDFVCAEFFEKGEAVDLEKSLKELIDSFKAPKKETQYKEVSDETFFCYIKNIDTENKEFELMPMYEVSKEEYTAAMNGDKTIEINGEVFKIVINEEMWENFGIINLEGESGNGLIYESLGDFELVEGYTAQPYIKVPASDSLVINHQFAGAYENPDASTFEKDFTFDEYMPHFAEYYMGSYYQATIENGELVNLVVMYAE